MPKPVIPVDPKVEPVPALEKRVPSSFTSEYKLSILQQADACKHGEIGKLLRREKLYSNQLQQWRRELAEQGVDGLKKSALGPVPRILSVNLMSNGPISATNSIDIGFSMPLIPRENESWHIPLAHATMRHAVGC